MPPIWVSFMTILAILCALLYKPAVQRLTVMGIFRENVTPMLGHEVKTIENTLQCEDLHHDRASNLLFAACQTGDPSKKHRWFPSAEKFDESAAGTGTIVVVDPTTFEATELTLKGFSGPFVTHGIDIYSSPADPSHVTIFAVNHLPHPDASPSTPPEAKARSQIEVFRHTIGSQTAHHIRSIRHSLIRTPNDIYATSPTSFYVTNDYYYRTGLGRIIETFATRPIASWTDIVHISFSDTDTTDATEGVKATTALTGLHNNNGLGHGAAANPSLVAIGDASGGELTLASRNLAPRPRHPEDLKLEILEHIQIDSTIDNPSWYDDPYAISAANASGFIVTGLPKVLDVLRDLDKPNPRIPVMVWHVTPQDDGTWRKKIIFQDDGAVISSAATALIVPVDPVDNEGKKQGWLFVTGFFSKAMVASLIDL